MRKTVILLAALMLVTGGPAKAEGTSNKIVSLANQYKHNDDFEVVKVGPFLMKIINWTANKEAGKEDADALSMMKGIKKIVVVDYENASEKIRSEFNAKVQRILAKSEILMEAKDDGDLVKIYGDVTHDGEKVSDLVIFVPNDGALICMMGTVDMKNVQNLIEGTRQMR